MARKLGAADVGQTVVVKGGTVLVVEAVEGTDATIRRAGELGGKGGVVVKVCKPGQDERFDLPAVEERTPDVMHEAGKALLLDAPAMFAKTERFTISVAVASPVASTSSSTPAAREPRRSAPPARAAD